MKKRHSSNYNVKAFKKMIEKGDMTFDSPIQRSGEQWTDLQKSLLVHSILTDYAIPPIYSVGMKEYNKEIYSVLDGKQRLTSLVDYVNDKFVLNMRTPSVMIEDEKIDIKGKLFSQLSEEHQDIILSYDILMYYFVNVTEEEMKDMFLRLNNGTPLSNQQKAKARMSISAARRLNELTEHPFMKKNAYLSNNQVKKADDEQVIVQAMMIMDENFVLNSFGAKFMSHYANLIQGEKMDILDRIERSMDYLHASLGDYTDPLVLKKTQLPMIINIGYDSANQGVGIEIFAEWLKDFKMAIENKSKIQINYNEYIGAGSITPRKVKGRMKEMERHFSKYLEKNKANVFNS